jgi:hypothetical protein
MIYFFPILKVCQTILQLLTKQKPALSIENIFYWSTLC